MSAYAPQWNVNTKYYWWDLIKYEDWLMSSPSLEHVYSHLENHLVANSTEPNTILIYF